MILLLISLPLVAVIGFLFGLGFQLAKKVLKA
jgi:high-affinity nickel permease